MYREQNCDADALANKSYKFALGIHIFDSPFFVLYDVLDVDASSVTIPRLILCSLLYLWFDPLYCPKKKIYSNIRKKTLAEIDQKKGHAKKTHNTNEIRNSYLPISIAFDMKKSHFLIILHTPIKLHMSLCIRVSLWSHERKKKVEGKNLELMTLTLHVLKPYFSLIALRTFGVLWLVCTTT